MNNQKNFINERICRTCMTKDEQIDIVGASGSSNLQSIYDFSNSEQDIRIAELLTTTIPQLLIQPMDNLPKLICARCVERLLFVRQFQLMCIQSEQRMRIMLESNENDLKYTQFPELSIPLMIDDAGHDDPLQSDTPMAANNDIQDFLKLEMNDKEIDVDTISAALTQKDHCKYNANQTITEKSVSLEVKNEDESESDTRFSNNTVKDLQKSECIATGCSAESFISAAHHEVQFAENIKDEESLEESLPPKPEGYKCDKCPRRFAKQKSLITHKKSHIETTLIESYACDLCFKKFKRSHALTKHKQTHRNIKTEEGSHKPYVCQYCEKAFQQSCTLKDHLRTHTGEQPFLCSECGKAFNSSSNMKQHLLRHSGLKRYECPDCPKKFPCLSDLASHKAVHRKFKPHICDVCNASFGKPYQLKKHKMYHNGEKPHKCEYCEMRFVCADHMRRHMRTHTGEKPYKCKYCDRAFAQSNDLIKHLRSHLGENVYKCELCPKAFRLATELRQHFVDHKNDDEETRQRNFQAMMQEEEKLKISLKI